VFLLGIDSEPLFLKLAYPNPNRACLAFSGTRHFIPMSVVSISTPFNIDLEFNVATPGRRAIAWIVDGIVLTLYALAFRYAVENSLPDNDSWRLVLTVFILDLPLLLYHFLMEVFFHGQSLGKMLLGIRVVNIKGNEASISQYLIRLLFRAYTLAPIVAGVIVFMFFDISSSNQAIALAVSVFATLLAMLALCIYFLVNKYGQRLGDKLADTLVIENRSIADFQKTIYLEISDQAYQVKFPQVMRLTDRDINGIRNLLDVTRITREHEGYMNRIAGRIQEVLSINTELDAYDFLSQLLQDYNFLTSK